MAIQRSTLLTSILAEVVVVAITLHGMVRRMSTEATPTSDEVKAMIRKAAMQVATVISQSVLDAGKLQAAAAFFSAPVVADALNTTERYFAPPR